MAMSGSGPNKNKKLNCPRPSSCSVRSGRIGPGALPGGWSQTKFSQKHSAKDWVERCNARRELEAVKRKQWIDTSEHFKTVQLKADLYHHKPAAPRCCPTPAVQNEWDCDTASEVLPVNESQNTQDPATRHPLPCDHGSAEGVFQPDEADAASSSGLRCEKIPILSDASTYLKPEIAALKARLEELKKRNAEERRKLNEELSFRAWQKNSAEVRQLESERLQQFVRSAWIDQRKWKEDEKLRRELEEKKIEEEAAAIRKRQEEQERMIAREKQAKREHYQKELEEQLEAMKKQKEESARLEAVANDLVCERDKLMALAEQRERIIQARKSRNLAVSWARQHHIKLRQRAVQVIQEVNEDLALMREFMDLQARDRITVSAQQDDLTFVMSVLEEHKKLEQLREKEYDLLFSEEAARLWNVREQQWEREAAARDKLFREVILARQRQIDEKSKLGTKAEDDLKRDCEAAKQRVAGVEEELLRLDTKQRDVSNSDGAREAQGCDATSKTEVSEEKEAYHRKEIARLEAEMARLWGPLYTPPHHGRKKVHW